MPSNTASTLIPCLSYLDAPRAIEWLVQVFEFTPQMVVDGPGDTILHAQLTSGGGMIMLGSISKEGDYAKLMAQPADIGGRQTQTIYLIVDDVDAVYARALDHGAVMVLDIDDKDYGGRGFTCRDLEGHVWSIGSYDPWQEAAP